MTCVLVIDDDPAIRQVVTLTLADEGYKVETAADGRAGLALIAREHPDVILVDMKMPAMDGWEFVRIYRERYDHQAPIIVFTAARDAAQRGAAVNAESYLAKPFDLDTLLERVAALVKPVGANS